MNLFATDFTDLTLAVFSFSGLLIAITIPVIICFVALNIMGRVGRRTFRSIFGRRK